jgi:chlorite dismutase
MIAQSRDTSRSSITRVSFVASGAGDWRIDDIRAIRGAGLPAAAAVSRLEGAGFVAPAVATWLLRGVRSNERYLAQDEKRRLVAVQEGLGRPASRHAALIPIRKSDAWWDLAQDERRAIFEERSAHIAIGSRYLPAIARRLYHGRDLGEPFDFLTWFEFAEADAGAFDDLVCRLRETEEWRYVDREVEIRVSQPPVSKPGYSVMPPST